MFSVAKPDETTGKETEFSLVVSLEIMFNVQDIKDSPDVFETACLVENFILLNKICHDHDYYLQMSLRPERHINLRMK